MMPRPHPTRTARGLTMLIGCTALACVSTIHDPTAGGGQQNGNGTTGGGAAPGGNPNPPGNGSPGNGSGGSTGGGGAMPAVPSPQPSPHLHRLTATEFSNSVRALLGSDVPLSDLEPDQESDGFRAVAASVVTVSPLGIARYEAATGAATEWLFADPARATKVLPCMPTGTTDTACLNAVVNGVGRRAFRRPLTTTETNRFVGIATAIAAEPGSSVLVGLRYALWAVLQSPNFLYRIELGVKSPQDNGRSKYTDHEVSSRLASLLWASVPDDALLDAAGRNELQTAEGVRKQATRMLATPQARQAFFNFVDDLYDLHLLPEAIKDPKLFPGWTPGLRDAMREELFRRMEDLVWGTPADFLSLYDQTSTFVNNELARHYGLPVVTPDGFRKVALPANSPRRGILGSGALLSAYALPQRTSPTTRGKFILEALLCRTVPPPPANVDTNLDLGAVPSGTLREQLDQHAKNPACAACHRLMDPMGLALENFDSVGAYRQTDGSGTIDPSGVIDGQAFKDAAELATILRKHPDAASCLVSKLYAHAQGRAPMTVDQPVIKGITEQFVKSGHRVDQLLIDLAASDAFRFVEVAP